MKRNVEKVELKIKEGFRIHIKKNNKEEIINFGRSQCRTKHKRKDC